MENKVWPSRKIARRIARANMRRAGVTRINKCFAQLWRQYQ